MQNIFDEQLSLRQENIFVFGDERKKIKNRWDYICLLLIPSERIRQVYQILENHRQTVDYFNPLKFSELNPKGTGKKFELAKKWIQELVDDAKQNGGNFYFKILGLDNHKLDFTYFGEDSTQTGKYATVYNRFFRANLLGAIKYFFKKDNNQICIDALVHDSEGHLQAHEYFDWHCIWKISSDEKDIIINQNKIIFVRADHKIEQNYPEYSHFIQFVDLIIGSVTYCIDYTNPNNKSQKEVAKMILPFVDRIIKNPYNKNSSLGYFKKYDIDFFPSDEVKDPIHLMRGGMYKNRTVLLKSSISRQVELEL